MTTRYLLTIIREHNTQLLNFDERLLGEHARQKYKNKKGMYHGDHSRSKCTKGTKSPNHLLSQCETNKMNRLLPVGIHLIIEYVN